MRGKFGHGDAWWLEDIEEGYASSLRHAARSANHVDFGTRVFRATFVIADPMAVIGANGRTMREIANKFEVKLFVSRVQTLVHRGGSLCARPAICTIMGNEAPKIERAASFIIRAAGIVVPMPAAVVNAAPESWSELDLLCARVAARLGAEASDVVDAAHHPDSSVKPTIVRKDLTWRLGDCDVAQRRYLALYFKSEKRMTIRSRLPLLRSQDLLSQAAQMAVAVPAMGVRRSPPDVPPATSGRPPKFCEDLQWWV